ncbi:4-cresol dehydrogenase (hydroxylating) [Nonomuraea solani]|uniref:4-cresol dehydrogenase (Hydroxylating) n=1 Tax=Nonomuraea solani TaxID=1144553 RepID=A0A1H6EJ38_9ACTN|nr:FAD-binding oxidoreductase [Nonomuraea solani]SEG97171.1 4-cresol dehydrogenase (hydroxylating) [Nonomuraea solani]
MQGSPRLELRSRDVGGHQPRTVAGVDAPRGLDEVRALVRQAMAAGLRLYPISTGRNWGMGSAMPVTDDNLVVDLSGMNRVRSLDLDDGFAVIEPGVTQRQLAAVLRDTPWMLNVTASCADTSVVGNALDRGDGCIRSRVHDVAGIEAVLADGSVVTTGGLDPAGRYHGRVAGPDLTPAFIQHNLGIVTAMAVSLVPRPQTIGLVHGRMGRDQVGAAVGAITGFLRRGNPADGLLRVRELSLTPAGGDWMLPAGVDPGLFTVLGPLMGSDATVELAEELLRKALIEVEGAEALRVVDAAEVSPDDPLYPRALMAQGIPTCRGVHNALGVTSCDLIDEGEMGFLALLPLLPMHARRTEHLLAALRTAVDAHSTALMVEWNFVGKHLANGVIQIFFERGAPGAPYRAHQLRNDGNCLLRGHGCAIYRSDIDHAAADVWSETSTASLGMLHRLKTALDPDGLLSPGRYGA